MIHFWITKILSDETFTIMGKLWNSSICSGSGASCITIVGDRLDGTSKSSSSESRFYIDIDEDELSSQSSILIGFLCSMAALIFSNLNFCLSASLSIWTIWSRVGILDFTRTQGVDLHEHKSKKNQPIADVLWVSLGDHAFERRPLWIWRPKYQLHPWPV